MQPFASPPAWPPSPDCGNSVQQDVSIAHDPERQIFSKSTASKYSHSYAWSLARRPGSQKLASAPAGSGSGAPGTPCGPAPQSGQAGCPCVWTAPGPTRRLRRLPCYRCPRSCPSQRCAGCGERAMAAAAPRRGLFGSATAAVWPGRAACCLWEAWRHMPASSPGIPWMLGVHLAAHAAQSSGACRSFKGLATQHIKP